MSAVLAAYDLAPALGVIGAGALVALRAAALVLAPAGAAAGAAARLHALALLVLVLSFDLVLLGAFTRLSDSGLGCPDWPGCYGHATPLGASAPIAAAEAAVPTGAVTATKAWIEMVHRYAATAIGVLVARPRGAGAGARAALRAHGHGRWAIVTLLWICLQGAFGALTVTMRLYPAIVTLHLLGGMGLLALLADPGRELRAAPASPSAPGLRAGLIAVAALAVLQIALGGWVSTNYAVLACSDFPTCQGAGGRTWTSTRDSSCAVPSAAAAARRFLPFAALTAIHMAHRLGALVLLPALAAARPGGCTARRRRGAAVGIALAALIAWQAASGLGNVLLGWPLAGRGRAHGGRGRARRRPDRAARAQRAGACDAVFARCRRRAGAGFIESTRHVGNSRPGRAAQRHAAIEAAPVLRADQAARRPADRLLRPDRHAAGDARPARLAPGAGRRWSASGSSPRRRRRSTAWSSSASIRAWRAPRGAPPPPAS